MSNQSVLDGFAEEQPGIDKEVHTNRHMHYLKIWRKACSKVTFSGILVDPHPLPLFGAAAAEALRVAWAPVFAAKPTSTELEDRFVAHVPANAISNYDFPEAGFVEKMLSGKRDSSPGPDGLRYAAWCEAGPRFAGAIEAYIHRIWLGGRLSSEDRAGISCYIPKRPSPGGLRPLEARPITMTNIPYKLVAALANSFIAEALPSYIDDRQKGFIKGRLGIEHILDLDAYGCGLAASGAAHPAIILLDIQAAFPSLSHRYLTKTIRKFAGDHPVARIIADLYEQASTEIIVNGEIFPGFFFEAGVKQGCPASGSLFALAFHGLLVELATIDAIIAGRACLRVRLYAYADDLAVAVSDIWCWIQRAAPIFRAFLGASALMVKPAKTILIPLWAAPDFFRTKRRAGELYPDWAGISVASQGTYLGVLIGPAVSPEARWEDPMSKFTARARSLSGLGLGWSYLIRIFNTVVASLIAYVGQVAALPPRFKVQLAPLLAKLFRIPFNRIPPWVFYHLDSLGLNLHLTDMQRTNLAAMSRVAHRLPHLQALLPAAPEDARGSLQPLLDEAPLVRLARAARSPYPEWREQLLAAQVLRATGEVKRSLNPEFDWQAPRLQARVLRNLRPVLHDAELEALFAARLRLVALRCPAVDDSARIARSLLRVIRQAGRLHKPLVPPCLKLACNAWHLGLSQSVCPFCLAEVSPDLAHLFACDAMFLIIADHLPRAPWLGFPPGPRVLGLLGASDRADDIALSAIAIDALWAAYVAASSGRGRPAQAFSARLDACSLLCPRVGEVRRLFT